MGVAVNMVQSNPDLSLQTFHIVVALSGIATLGVALRFVSRWLSRANFGADDGLIIVAWLFMVGLVVNSGYMYSAVGMCQPVSTLTQSQQDAFYQSFYASQILYYMTMLPTKLSILALYTRIFSTRSFRIAALVVAIICGAWGIGGVVPTIAQCQPLAKAWYKQLPGSCVNLGNLFIAITISNLLTDVLVLCLPIGMVWNLKLEFRQRMVLMVIFLMGAMVCVASLLRIIAQAQMDHTGSIIDFLVSCSLWTIVEPSIAILSACLPCMRPLLPAQRTLSKWSSRLTRSKESTVGSYTRKSWYGIPTGSSKRHGITTTTATANSISDLPLHALSESDEDNRVFDRERNWSRDPNDLINGKRPDWDWDREQYAGHSDMKGGRGNRLNSKSRETMGHLRTGILVHNEITVVGDAASDSIEEL